MSASPVNIMTWGSAHRLVAARSRVDLIRTSVDRPNNLLVLDVPACDTRIKFRTYDPTKTSQPLLPGVSVTVPHTAEVGRWGRGRGAVDVGCLQAKK